MLDFPAYGTLFDRIRLAESLFGDDHLLPCDFRHTVDPTDESLLFSLGCLDRIIHDVF